MFWRGLRLVMSGGGGVPAQGLDRSFPTPVDNNSDRLWGPGRPKMQMNLSEYGQVLISTPRSFELKSDVLPWKLPCNRKTAEEILGDLNERKTGLAEQVRGEISQCSQRSHTKLGSRSYPPKPDRTTSVNGFYDTCVTFLKMMKHKNPVQFLVCIFKRVVARRAVYHTLNVITISLYVHPSVCVKRV